jgi:hypothetical protein
MRRINKLTIQITCDGHGPEFVPEGFHLAPLQKLQSLYIDEGLSQEWKDHLFESISSSVRGDWSLGIHTPVTTITTLSDDAWGKIKTLNLLCGSSSSELDKMALKLSNVQQLFGTYNFWPSQDTPHCILQNIQVVSLRTDSKSFRRVKWPSLRELIVEEHCKAEANIDSELEPAHFACLTSMNIYSSRYPYHWFSNVSIPNLRHLRLKCFGDDTPIHKFSVDALDVFSLLLTLHLDPMPSDSHPSTLLRAYPISRSSQQYPRKTNSFDFQTRRTLPMRPNSFPV